MSLSSSIQATSSNQGCDWGSELGSPARSVAGMRGASWAVTYVERAHSSAARGYGTHPLEALVRLLPGEKAVDLRVFVDKSIVEVFAMSGRRAVTGRVYPSLANADRVGVFARGAAGAVRAEAFEMGAAFARTEELSRAR